MTTTRTGKRAGWRVAAMATALAFALAALAGCGQDESATGLTPEQNDEAQAMLRDYDAARRVHDWQGASKLADKLRRKYPDSEAMGKVRLTLDDVLARIDEAASAGRLAALWIYQVTPAGEGKQYTAQISSHVEEDENGNAVAEPDGRLVLRVHPDWGQSAYLLLAQKQFACGEPCTLQIAFDQGNPESYAGKQADSGNGPAVFIEERERFYAMMRTAQVVRITLPQTGSFAPTLRFDVGGYDAEKLGAPF